uniref:Uncharacterized protein AlNc14C84G5420 n=1 Tax=Albugo laibachii Nc14 TaxID=890382 RepID=F0WFN6_9STRA|nr:conserved hypothetical protein [Albugo laibachii Nc14]|eukprot:CCA20018.1 conserved hypothetical protein [Albugo laibachii Nc14]
MFTEVVMRYGRLSGMIAAFMTITTLITCYIIARVMHKYTNGLKWPFFSEIGRDTPAYYVFISGLTTIAVTMCIVWFYNAIIQRCIIHELVEKACIQDKAKSLFRMSNISVACVVLSSFGLPILSIYNTTYHRVHTTAAKWFFCLETIALFTNTYVSWKIYRFTIARSNSSGFFNEETELSVSHTSEECIKSRKRTYLIQVVALSIFAAAFLVYVVMGSFIDCQNLTINECLELDLGNEYCTEKMRRDEIYTVLSNCKERFALVQTVAVSQLICILTLLGYGLSFLAHHSTRNSTAYY